jgi:N-acetylglutamate synthase-like GNAT family acetyltransferase
MTSLRPATPEDCIALTELAVRSKAHWGYDEAFMAKARSELVVTAEDVATRRVRVAERDGSVVGFYALRLDDEPEVEMIFVDPQAIGSGVGGVLMRDALAAAREAGVESVVVQSDPQAEAFYRSQGFVPIGTRPSPSTGRILPLLRFTP